MAKHHLPLKADKFYHLYNRAIGNEKLFLSANNYQYFLTKMKQHILPVADIYAYCLLPNHFHLLVRIRSFDELISFYLKKKGKTFNEKDHNLPDFIMEQFSNWLNGYTKAFNKMYNRKGGLFIDYLKRNESHSEKDTRNFLFYIHKNPVHHGLTKNIGEWKYDSYNVILNNKSSGLQINEMMDWFGSRENFIQFHSQPINLKLPELE